MGRPRRSFSRHALLATVAASAALLCAYAAPALAGSGPQYGSIGQYGQVWRGGGFDTCWYDNGEYDGHGQPQGTSCTTGEAQPAGSEFIDPVGFAVDTQDKSTSDGTAIYVLDRTSNLPGDTKSVTTWRLQKLDDKGNVLGTDQFSLPDQDPNLNTDQSGVFNYEMQGLAVDPAQGVVYALVDAYDNGANGNVPPVASGSTEYVEEILAWSTTPSEVGATGDLVAASCPNAKSPATTCPDKLSTGLAGFPTPGIVSTATQLSQGGSPEGPLSGLGPWGMPQIVNPEGLAIDSTGGEEYLAVESGDVTSNGAGTGITQVCVSGAKCSVCPSPLPSGGWLACYDPSPGYGDIRLQWSANELTGLFNDNDESNLYPAGISTVPTGSPNAGSLTVLLDEAPVLGGGSGVASNIDVIGVPASLTADLKSRSSILSSGAGTSVPPGGPADYAAVTTADLDPENPFGDPDASDGGPLAATSLASPQVLALSNGLYAGEFEPDPVRAPDPQNPDRQPGLWTAQRPGVRLLQPLPDGTLSNNPETATNPPLTTLFDTLGNPNPNGVCSLTDAVSAAAGGTPTPSLAAGADGTVWVLTRGSDSSGGVGLTGSAERQFEGGRDLIELSPKQGAPCPAPKGTFTMAPPSGAPQSLPLSVKVGTTVTFDACPPPPPGQAQVICPTSGSLGVNNLGAAAAEYEWDFGDGTSATVVSTANAGGIYPWPQPTVAHQYSRDGIFTAKLTMLGDFGVYVETATVNVTPGTVPVASFTYGQAGSPPMTVDFDASASTPTPGNSIVNYHWDWGDGQIDDTSSPTDSHTYPLPGNYTVKLSVLDSVNGHSASPATETVAVAPPPPPPPPTTTTTATSPITPPPGPPDVTAEIATTASVTGKLSLVLSCPAGQTSCAGRIELKTAHAVGTRSSKKARKQTRHKRILILGRGSFSIPGGAQRLVTISLSRQAVSLLRGSRAVRVIATIKAINPQGKQSSSVYKLKLEIAKRHAHRRTHAR